jgi:deazaflavin-dependent oxidoreductase (nitroreductase family)
MDMKEFNKTIIEEFRANEGKVGGQFEGAPMLLLATVGAKSGSSRVNPLVYLMDGERYIIIASFAGAPNNPPWFHNLVANPVVELEVGARRFKAQAEVLAEQDRAAQYRRMAAMMPVFAEYERKTSRTIPVVALRPL